MSSQVTKEMLASVPKDVREAYIFAGGMSPSHPLHEWMNESMLQFIAWQESEARWDWRMKWIGGPVLTLLFVGWACLMIWGVSKGFPQ